MKYFTDFSYDNPFIPWQPSTWPEPPQYFNNDFILTIEKIFKESLLDEIKNVIDDAPTLEHRGHVVALSILSAIDSLSSYAFDNLRPNECGTCHRTDGIAPSYQEYIREFFPEDYKPYAKKIYKLYRNSITHSWNLFQAGMLPGNEQIIDNNGVIILGLKNLYSALDFSVSKYLNKLKKDEILQKSTLKRYSELKLSATSID